MEILVSSLGAILLLFFMSTGNLASELRNLEMKMLNLQLESNNSVKLPMAELNKFIDSLNWLARRFQYKNQLPYKLGPNYAQLFADLDDCKSKGDVNDCTTKTVDELFNRIIKSGSKPDKVNALQAADPFLDDFTAARLLNSALYKMENSPTLSNTASIKNDKNIKKKVTSIRPNFENLSTTIQNLSIEGIEPIDKNCANANIILKSRYPLIKTPVIDSSIWFLLNRLKFDKGFRKKFKPIADYIAYVIKYKITLRADVDIELLFNSVAMIVEKWRDFVFPWHGYIVENSPFRDFQLYSTKLGWGLISQSLLLKDPNISARVLDANLPIGRRGINNYSLLLHDNPLKQLLRVNPKNRVQGMYSCFIFASDVGSTLDRLEYVRELPKERLAELADYLIELNENALFTSKSVTQLGLAYVSLVSLFGNENATFKTSHARIVTQIPKTLELLDVIGNAKIILTEQFFEKSFNESLLEMHNWEESVGKHFHYFISKLMIKNYGEMATSLVEYIGVDAYEVLSTNKYRYLVCVDCTLEKIPRHLDSYFEAIYKQDKRNNINLSPNLEIAMTGSMISDKNVEIARKRDFIYYLLKGSRSLIGHLRSPVFVDFAYMLYKFKAYNLKELNSFLYFESLVYKYFSDLIRMDLGKGFQKLQVKNSFSAALKAIIVENFEWYNLPFTLERLHVLDDEMLKHNSEIAMEFQISRMSRMVLLKIIYLALSDPSPDLKLALIKHLFNTRILYKSSA